MEFLGFLWMIVIAGLYFLPTLVAYDRTVGARGAVFVVNGFFGLTGIGWIIALAMACGGKKE